MSIGSWLLIPAALLLAERLTDMARSYGERRQILDHPNERSSHDRPVPHTGGLAVSATLLAGCGWLAWQQPTERGLLAVLAGVIAAMALLGWQDDRRGLGPGLRLLVQLSTAAAALALLGWPREFSLGLWRLDAGWLAFPLCLLWVVWLTNLYNFMDGIDGIAAVETLVVAATFGVWFAAVGATALALLMGVLAAAALGFLRWNWAPARVFLGDSGSLVMGMLLGVVSVTGMARYDFSAPAVLLVLGVFVFDASWTLARRLLTGERVWQAHRSHFYQRAASRFGHAAVSLVVLVLGGVLAVVASAEQFRQGPAVAWWLTGLAMLAGAALAANRIGGRNS
ncbi:MAG: glycosyltransferase family 4 protein [Gammaproteobacteria bacterium]|nr:glycosyltransferase family 4 protein [Gammaproteobacteria bacterium]